MTRKGLFKVTDLVDSGRPDWTASFGAFPDDPDVDLEFQAITTTIVANGVAVSVDGGKLFGEREIMLKVGVGLIVRNTGPFVGFTEGREESNAVTSVGPNGGISTENSPVRRISGRALFPDLKPELIGASPATSQRDRPP